MPNTHPPLPDTFAFVSNGKAASISEVDAALRSWALAAVPDANFSLSIPSEEAPAAALVSAWLYKAHAKPQAKPVRGNSELRLTLHYLLTVWCGEEVRAHAALHSLFLAALTAPALSEGLQLTHVPEPPMDAFWLALKVPPRPCLLLTADLVLPRPPAPSAPLVREVLSRVAPSGPQRRSLSPPSSSSSTT